MAKYICTYTGTTYELGDEYTGNLKNGDDVIGIFTCKLTPFSVEKLINNGYLVEDKETKDSIKLLEEFVSSRSAKQLKIFFESLQITSQQIWYELLKDISELLPEQDKGFKNGVGYTLLYPYMSVMSVNESNKTIDTIPVFKDFNVCLSMLRVFNELLPKNTKNTKA